MKFVSLLLLITAASSPLSAGNNKNVTFIEAVTVAEVTLDAGNYLVEWDGSGSEVQVTFWRGKSKVVTVPAMFRPRCHRYDAITVRPEGPGRNTLIEIDSRDSELRFKEPAAVAH